jgi:hypothetical protein
MTEGLIPDEPMPPPPGGNAIRTGRGRRSATVTANASQPFRASAATNTNSTAASTTLCAKDVQKYRRRGDPADPTNRRTT